VVLTAVQRSIVALQELVLQEMFDERAGSESGGDL
jgi:hypothetical protein